MASTSSRNAPRSRGRSGFERSSCHFPSGRTADEVVLDDAAGLLWVANLGCLDLNPHAIRASDLEHPDELRIDLDPMPGVAWDDIRRVALVAREVLHDQAWKAGPRRRVPAGSTSTSGSSRAGRSIGSGEPLLPWPARSSAAPRSSPRASGGRRNATASSSTTTRTPRIEPSRRPIRSGLCPKPGCRRR